MSQIQISRRYAQSLFDLAQAQVDDVYAALNGIAQAVRQSRELREFIHNPLLSLEDRGKILSNVFEGRVPDLVKRFLLFISLKNRLDLLLEMAGAFEDLYVRAHNRTKALIVSALPLEETQREQIRRQLGQKYAPVTSVTGTAYICNSSAKEIMADWQVKPEILGGFRIFIEGKLYDYSFTSQLEEFKTRALCHNN